METTILGLNSATFPHLHIWDWRVVLYLFLGGLTAGAMVMSSVANLRKDKSSLKEKACCVRLPLIAPLLLAVGMFFLFLDLENKKNMFWFYMTLQPLSPMSWGSWALLAVYPVMILFGLSVLPEEFYPRLPFAFLKRLAATLQPQMRRLAAANFVMGILLGVYTGVLLSSYVARPLWNSALLPVLFLISALSSGAALAIIMAKQDKAKLFFTKVDIWLLFAEIFVLVGLFYGHYSSTEAHREAIMPFFDISSQHFPYAISIILLSIVLPGAIVLKFLEVRVDHEGPIVGRAKTQMITSAALVLVGALIIRFAIVYAGQLSSLSRYTSIY